MARKSGWKAAQKHRTAGLVNSPLEVKPCAWQKLLADNGLSEEEAAADRVIRSWVKRHCRSRYVPLKVLDALGIPEQACL